MRDLLFHTPWWLPIAIVATGIGLFITGNKRVENKLRMGGLAVVLLGIALAITSYLVDTPMEKAEKRTAELIAAFERQDYATMGSILDTKTAVTVSGSSVFTGRDAIVARAKSAQQQYQFKSVRLLTSHAEQTDTVITINVVLLSEQNALASTLNSEWQFQWQQFADGLGLVEIRALKIGQTTGDQIRGMFPR